MARAGASARGGGLAAQADQFVQSHCVECHDADSKKGGLDLTSLPFDLENRQTFARWVKVHDRVEAGEMPPKKQPQPAREEVTAFLSAIAQPMVAADQARQRQEGRSTLRRLNRYEYEASLRDLLETPWLQIRDMLPEDGEAYRFNKVGDALDVSHVQMARYLAAADSALRSVMASRVQPPVTTRMRYYARSQPAFQSKLIFTVFNRSPERGVFPLLGNRAQLDLLTNATPPPPMTAGFRDPIQREQEAFGVVASSYEPIELRFDRFAAPMSGRYRLRLCAYSFWAGPMDGPRWWTPDRRKASAGRRPEPVTLYSDTQPRLLRWLGSFDVNPEPTVAELETDLLAGETIRPDAARLFRSRPPSWHNPLATKEGQPGVAFKWLEVQGPLIDQWPPAGHRALFGDLPLRDNKGAVEVVSTAPREDAERLLRSFLQRAYRHPVQRPDVDRFLPLVLGAMQSGSTFSDAMIAGYSAVLCSPEFVYLREQPGRLDDYALAERLSYFLWNSQPDAELRALAASGTLHDPRVLDAQTRRLLASDRSRRFVEAFLSYWLDLRKINATSPDATLYPDYYLDDLLVESAEQETRLFFTELLKNNLPARHIVDSDFAMLNERLAQHYGLPPVQGVALRRVRLPEQSVRGGLLTQASVLKVTANGTTTSPVLRGAWVMERILGKPPPKPPPSVPAIEPDTRGATTIRAQLEKHRTLASCSACHAKIDPAGFALENFDVFGGWRDEYRALGEGKPLEGIGKNGQKFTFHAGPTVDAGGALPDGRSFTDIRSLKKLLAADERQLARNLVNQLLVYATGAPASFGDRPRVEQILDRAKASDYGVQTLLRELVLSDLFANK